MGGAGKARKLALVGSTMTRKSMLDLNKHICRTAAKVKPVNEQLMVMMSDLRLPGGVFTKDFIMTF